MEWFYFFAAIFACAKLNEISSVLKSIEDIVYQYNRDVEPPDY